MSLCAPGCRGPWGPLTLIFHQPTGRTRRFPVEAFCFGFVRLDFWITIIFFRFDSTIIHQRLDLQTIFHQYHLKKTTSTGNIGVGQYYMGPFGATNVVRQEGHIFVVDEDRCFGCAACVALCPVDALSLQGLLAIVVESSCTHCELCIPSCPVFALDIVEGVGLEASF